MKHNSIFYYFFFVLIISVVSCSKEQLAQVTKKEDALETRTSWTIVQNYFVNSVSKTQLQYNSVPYDTAVHILVVASLDTTTKTLTLNNRLYTTWSRYIAYADGTLNLHESLDQARGNTARNYLLGKGYALTDTTFAPADIDSINRILGKNPFSISLTSTFYTGYNLTGASYASNLAVKQFPFGINNDISSYKTQLSYTHAVKDRFYGEPGWDDHKVTFSWPRKTTPLGVEVMVNFLNMTYDNEPSSFFKIEQ